MAVSRKNRSSGDHSAGCFLPVLWKRGVLAAILLALVIGSTGCALDDLLAPFAGDIPFEQDETMPSEMGAVDNIPTVPEDDSAMDTFRPLT